MNIASDTHQSPRSLDRFLAGDHGGFPAAAEEYLEQIDSAVLISLAT